MIKRHDFSSHPNAQEEINATTMLSTSALGTGLGVRFVVDANLVADAPPGKVEERRCRKELSTVSQCESFGAH
jgi:hypothetical protein